MSRGSKELGQSVLCQPALSFGKVLPRDCFLLFLLHHFQQHRLGGVLGVFLFALGQDDEGVRRRLDPWLGIDGKGPAAFLLGDQDAVEADVEYADAVWQATDIERHPAFEAVAAVDLHR